MASEETKLTVGDLVEELQRLPLETPIRSEYAMGVDVVLFNAPTRHSHVRFEEAGIWDNDDDNDDDLDADDDDEWFDDPEPRDDGGPL